jgi:hypothetical protein
MAKRQTHATKKGKSAAGHKSKSHKGRKGSPKRGGKHQKSKASKRSNSSSSSKRQGHKQKGKSPSKFNLFMNTTVPKFFFLIRITQGEPGIKSKDAKLWTESSDNMHH